MLLLENKSLTSFARKLKVVKYEFPVVFFFDFDIFTEWQRQQNQATTLMAHSHCLKYELACKFWEQEIWTCIFHLNYVCLSRKVIFSKEL